MKYEYRLPEVLRETLKVKKIPQRKLADEIGVGWGSVNRWLSYGATPNLMTLIDIASVLDVSLDFLVYGVDSNNTCKISDACKKCENKGKCAMYEGYITGLNDIKNKVPNCDGKNRALCKKLKNDCYKCLNNTVNNLVAKVEVKK